MKKLLIIKLTFLSCFSYAQSTLHGKVMDKGTDESLVGAVIYFPDLKTGTVTNAEGQYTIANLPTGNFLVQVKFLGYEVITENILLKNEQEKNFALEPAATEAKEVVVTGSAFATDNNRNSTSLNVIDKITLRTQAPGNFINTLSSVPGVAEITTGGGVSKPVIRGLGYNHVITVSEGMRQEGNQWGDEHGIEIDQFAVDRVEILKGPASLFYGSDAMGGVINIVEPMPANLGKIDGEISSNFSLNNKLTANSLSLQGNQNGFVWRARGTFKSAASYQTPEEYVYNSGFNEKDGNILLGFNKRWGYSHLFFSRYDANIGAIEAEKDSIGNFVDVDGNVVSEKALKGRELELPLQHILHNKIASVNNFVVKGGLLKVNVGYQTNIREEFAESSEIPGLSFLLATTTGDVKYKFPFKDNLEAVIGLSGMLQENENKGSEFLVPDYSLADMGGFAYLKKAFRKFTINGGLRYDQRSIIGKSLFLDSAGQPSTSGDTLFGAFEKNISAVTGAIGFTFNINKQLNLKGNIGRGFRAPNIAELASNGIHEGTFRYEIGNNRLDPETSLQLDGEINFDTKKMSFALGAFYNLIDQYIYKRNINNEVIAIDNEVYPVYRYVQGKSLLKGFEITMDLHPIEQLHFENTLSLVSGRNLETRSYLPFIPATHSSHDLRWDIKLSNKMFKNPYLKIGLNYHFKQDQFDAFETTTASYTLLNAGAGIEIKVAKQFATLFITATNLLDVKYYDHLSRLKDYGIYNMGRNISFGVFLPLAVK